MVPSAVLKTETFKSLEDRAAAKLKILCPNCGGQSNFPGVVSRENGSISGLICVQCKEQLPLPYLKNRVKLAIKQLLNTYYKGKSNILTFIGEYVCSEPACRTETRSLLINGKCIQPACKGKVQAQLSEKLLNDTLRYLQGLFDVDKYKRENPSKDHEQLRVHED